MLYTASSGGSSRLFMSMIDLSIVTISTNEAHQLVDSIESVLAGRGDLKIEYFIVDNASADGTSELVSRYPEITLIKNSKKRGFSTNNNLALMRSTGRYVLLLNPDTILDKDTLPGMIAYLDAQPGIGAASCKLLNPDGTVQYNARNFPTILTVLLRWIGFERLCPDSKVIGHYLIREWDRQNARDVDWIIGAFLMVRREVINSVGLLDVAFDPLYFEDIDWCYRIKKSGWRVCFIPDYKIVHLYDRESARSIVNRMTVIHFINMVRFFHKHRMYRL